MNCDEVYEYGNYLSEYFLFPEIESDDACNLSLTPSMETDLYLHSMLEPHTGVLDLRDDEDLHEDYMLKNYPPMFITTNKNNNNDAIIDIDEERTFENGDLFEGVVFADITNHPGTEEDQHQKKKRKIRQKHCDIEPEHEGEPSKVRSRRRKKQCHHCGTSRAPAWRKGFNNETLCNACGLYVKLHGKPREMYVEDGVTKVKRNPKPIRFTCDLCKRSVITSIDDHNDEMYDENEFLLCKNCQESS